MQHPNAEVQPHTSRTEVSRTSPMSDEPAQTLYRLSWTMCDPHAADAMHQATGNDEFPNAALPPTAWENRPRTIVTTQDPRDQYTTLKDWADRDVAGVRHVLLERAEVTEPQWVSVTRISPIY